MRYKTVIWDFNGTLLSDMGSSISAMNVVLKRRGLPIIPSLKAFQDVFGFPVKDYYRRIGIDFSKEPYEVPADEWVELYSKEMFSSPLTKNAKEALDRIKGAGIRQIILSASEKSRLCEHLLRLGIMDYFDEIHGISDVYAKGKREIALDLSKREELFPAVLVGDTDHDLECAKAIGCDALLFSGGFMSEERLLTLNVPVFDDLLSIADVIISK